VSVVDQDQPVAWQTALQVIGATLLIYPLIFVTGMVANLVAWIHADSIGFIMRGMQFFVAGFGALQLPALVLKRSNPKMAAGIWITFVTTVT
jgi:uncharacterized membrane protein